MIFVRKDADTVPGVPGRHVDADAARSWIRYHFDGMSVVLERVAAAAGDLDSAHVLVDEAFSGDVTLDNTGRGLDQDSQELVRATFSHMYARGARTLVVEDEAARRSDDLRDAFYVHDSVLRSVALDDDSRAAADLLLTGSLGYPRNALVCSETEADLGLVAGISLSDDVVTLVARSTVAAVTSVWDDETYLVVWGSGSLT